MGTPQVMGYHRVMRWIDRALKVAKQRGLTQRDIARAAGVEYPRVNQWKTGKGRVFLDQAAKIATALGVSLDWLAGEDKAAEGPVPEPVDAISAEPDVKLLLRAIELRGLTVAQAIDRILTAEPGGAPARVVAERTLAEGKPPGNPSKAHVEVTPGPRK